MTHFNQITDIEAAIEKHFERKRVVFWYDKDGAMRDQFEAVNIDGIEKITIDNNEFSIKHKVRIEQPKTRFLIYAPFARPEDKDNWLVDIVLSGDVFTAEVSSLYLKEIGLPLEFKYLIEKHKALFDSAERRGKVAKIVLSTDTEQEILLKCLSVITATDPDWDKIWYALFEEALVEKKTKIDLIKRCEFAPILWAKAELLGYTNDEPTIKDMLLTLFSGAFQNSIGKPTKSFTPEAKIFFNRWRENLKYSSVFVAWSKYIEDETNIKQTIASMEINELLDSDIYSVIDQKIITILLNYIIGKTESDHIIQAAITARRSKMFIGEYENLYKALSAASTLQFKVYNSTLTASSVADMLGAYTAEQGLQSIDRTYRNYIYYSQSAEFKDVLATLTEHIEKLYANSYLLPLSDSWQLHVNNMDKWCTEHYLLSQREFYKKHITPYTNKGNRVFVIISDALRYESGVELKDRFLALDRYEATISPAISVVPSYTQLGMAALLPHKELSYEKENDTVFVDGVSSSSTANRTKILQKEYAESIAITAEDFKKMNGVSGREFCKQYKVIYIYSNTIDKAGDDKTSEGKVFKATEEEFDGLIELVKKISNSMNGNNIIITSDHGYLYQDSKLDESDFTEFEPEGDIYKTNRRFVIGKNLKESDAVNKWSAEMLRISGDIEILTAKSSNRIRVQGAGSRFVHGGSSLQEIVLPIIEINKKREDTLQQVEVDAIGLPRCVTSNFFPVNFYQQKAITSKIVSRKLKATFYVGDIQISDSVTLIFDSADSDSRKREQKYTFTFSPEVSKYSKQSVILKLEEPISDSSQSKVYKTYALQLMIAFSSEFDF